MADRIPLLFLFIVMAACATDARKQTANPDSSVDTTLIVTGPVVVPFLKTVSQAEVDKDEDLATALDDFQYYLAPAAEALQKLGYTMHDIMADHITVKSGSETIQVPIEQGQGSLGYFFFAPGQPAVTCYGVMTDVDILAAAKEYKSGKTSELRVCGEVHVRRAR